jgi:hypothetical protein
MFNKTPSTVSWVVPREKKDEWKDMIDIRVLL